MKSEDHLIAGALIGLGGYLLYKFIKKDSPDLIEAILSLFGGAIAGLLPDLLEPANSPNHRSLFHSIALVAFVLYGNYRAWQNADLNENQKITISLLSAAYSSHLLADSTTAKGLPVLF